MKKLVALFLALVLCLLLVGCNKQDSNETDLQYIYENAGKRVYMWRESDSVVKPSVALLENNRFHFTFSSVSSYLGMGTYTIADNILVLNTDDGLYTYTFEVEMEGDAINRLIFDAENSSKVTHYGNFEDGDIFE